MTYYLNTQWHNMGSPLGLLAMQATKPFLNEENHITDLQSFMDALNTTCMGGIPWYWLNPLDE